MDDVDYYPEPYLDRLAHEGINGLWLTIEWRDLAETSFTKRSPDAMRRIEKLRKTVARCLKYGIKTWVFCIEPHRCGKDDPLFREHPELFGCTTAGEALTCPLQQTAQRYIEETVKDLFTQVPGLGGILMISYGERATTCLSKFDPLTGSFNGNCPRCAGLEPWRIHWETANAIMRGIRAAGSDAEYISWFYQPQVRPERGAWSADVARHLPDGVTHRTGGGKDSALVASVWQQLSDAYAEYPLFSSLGRTRRPPSRMAAGYGRPHAALAREKAPRRRLASQPRSCKGLSLRALAGVLAPSQATSWGIAVLSTVAFK